MFFLRGARAAVKTHVNLPPGNYQQRGVVTPACLVVGSYTSHIYFLLPLITCCSQLLQNSLADRHISLMNPHAKLITFTRSPFNYLFFEIANLPPSWHSGFCNRRAISPPTTLLKPAISFLIHFNIRIIAGVPIASSHLPHILYIQAQRCAVIFVGR